jgi:D-alanyl-D-alanine carboxypeptidase (penicillin-binding protein 5/6)
MVFIALAAVLAASWTAVPAAAAPTQLPLPRVGAPEGVVMDAATGAVLWQRNEHRAVPIASTTKILTALVAQDSYPANAVLTVPKAAEQVDGTRFGYLPGMRIRLHDLFTTLLMVSANDAAETLAAAYPHGGRAGFIRAMNEEAVAYGCTDSSWRDPSGLDVPGHRASAADLAILGRALLARPLLAKIVATPSTPYRWPSGHTQILGNHNHFVSFGRDPGALGIKTGFTDLAHATIVAAQRRAGRTLIAAALGAPTAAASYDDVRAMFAYGFASPSRPQDEVLGRGARRGLAAGSAADVRLLPKRQATAAGGSPVHLLRRRLLGAPLPLALTVAIFLVGAGAVVIVGWRPGTSHGGSHAARSRAKAAARRDAWP